jgi:hypothetical protein
MVVDDDDGSEVLKCFGVWCWCLRWEMDGRASVVGKHSDTRTGGERASSMRAILYVRTISNRSLPLPGAGSRQRSTVDSFAFSLFALSSFICCWLAVSKVTWCEQWDALLAFTLLVQFYRLIANTFWPSFRPCSMWRKERKIISWSTIERLAKSKIDNVRVKKDWIK